MALTFDGTIHLSDILTTIIVPIVGYGALKVYSAVSTFVDRTDETADVVDVHTDVLTKAGWTRGMEIPKVGPRQRKRRTMFLGLAMLLAFASSASAQAVVPALTELRRLYPTPMSKPQISELLDRAALANPGWKLLKKDGGNTCPTPYPGVTISCDWMFSPDGWGFDVLRDQEGVGQPGVFGDAALAAGQELVSPWEVSTAPAPTPVPVPVPQLPPAPSYDFAAAFQRAYDQSERIYLDELNWRRDLGKQVTDLNESVNNPGWFKQVFSNRYVQMAIAGIGTYLTVHMASSPQQQTTVVAK